MLLSIVTLVITLLASTSPLYAAAHEEPTKVWPPPITDPSKAVPFSHPLDNTLNPASPNYDPTERYGTPGTRFGPPGQRSSESPLRARDEMRGVGHRVFGTSINTYSNVTYAYAQHTYYSDVTVPENTNLCAPTLMCSNLCPLEIVTHYWVHNGMKREIAVYNHYTGIFESATESVNDYLSSGFYTAEILKSGSTWYAMIYNYSTSQWETLYSESGSGTYYYGWDIWEEWGFNESNWPDLDSKRFEAKSVIIHVGASDYYVTSTYGSAYNDVGTAPYSFNWVNNYYRWYVQD